MRSTIKGERFEVRENYIKGLTPPRCLLHLVCLLTLWEYGWGRIVGIFGVRELKRERWRQ
jgi:hypothetical protein